MKKTGFTLVEVLLATAVIGVVMAMLIPSIKKIMPNQDEARARKAYNTLANVVESLTNDNDIYLDGMLDKLPNGEKVSDTYFCQQFAEKVNVLGTINCSYNGASNTTVDSATNLDSACKDKTTSYSFKTADGVYWYGMHDKFDSGKYTVICIKTKKDGKKVDSYGFGVRNDGKMILGSKIQALLDKDD